MADEIKIRYFEKLPSVRRIMETRIALEHKRIAAACVQNYQNQKDRGELGEEDLDQMMNKLKVWIYGFTSLTHSYMFA